MDRGEVITKLLALEPSLRTRGIEALYLFGSTARGGAASNSDIDLIFELEPGARLGLGYFEIKQAMADALGRPIDLTTFDGLHLLIREEVRREAVRIF